MPGATQYDIYRSYTSSVNTKYSPNKNGYGDGKYALSNAKWEKVKTITKAKTVTYTDKKLKKGTNYDYRVVATYASGKKSRQVFATASVILKMESPKNLRLTVSKNNVKVTWDKDAFASKYEIKYKKYDAEGRPEKDTWTTKSTKKNSYAIKKVAKGITAKEITEKNAKGTKTAAVQVKWSKVPDAAYYVVHRSTSPAAYYNQDKKVYDKPSDSNWALISKESNADEDVSYSTVPYREYKFIEGSVVGTKTVDRARLQTGVTYYYYYYVTAYSADGRRISDGYSKPASICYKAVVSIKSIKARKGKVTLKMTKVSKAKKYVIYRSTKKSTGFEMIGTAKSSTYVDKTVKKGKKYYYKVVAIGSGANGLKGDIVTNASSVKSVKAK